VTAPPWARLVVTDGRVHGHFTVELIKLLTFMPTRLINNLMQLQRIANHYCFMWIVLLVTRRGLVSART
jgi:hypothetical protein